MGRITKAAQLAQQAKEVLAGPNASHLQPAFEALKRLRAEVSQGMQALLAATDRAAREIEAARGGLTPVHVEQEARYQKLLASHAQEKVRSDERLALERRRQELLDRAARLEERQRPLAAQHLERNRLRDRLLSLRDQLSKVRQGIAAWLTKTLEDPETNKDVILVSVAPQLGTDEFKRLVLTGLKGSHKQNEKLIEQILKLSPQRFAELVQAGDVEALASALGDAGKRAQGVIDQIHGTDLLYELDALTLDDVPTISLVVSGQPKEASSLSTGQRCTTILPLLLLEGTKPLLIDQPEDDLDNEYIFTVVVKKLERIKLKRQLIFVTHNPNIPVLGDAEHVIVLKPDGASARVADQDAVMKVREHVETILEGGKEAFERRRERYRDKR